jgi:hypothetical protein
VTAVAEFPAWRTKADGWERRLAPGTLLWHRFASAGSSKSGAWMVLSCQANVMVGPWVQLKVCIFGANRVDHVWLEEGEFRERWHVLKVDGTRY